MHPDQVAIDDDLVRRLIAQQLSRWSDLPITEVTSVGTVNAIYRLGDELCVRLPLQPGGVASLEREVEWLPWLAERLPFAVPEPVAVGRPGEGFPHPWAVYRWLPGETATSAAPGGEPLADDLAALVEAVRALEPAGAPRAGDRWSLRPIDPHLRTRIPDLATDGVDVDRATAVWDAAVAAPAYAGPPTWVHGDLLAANLLVADGRLVGVLDWGITGTGDPATDLVAAWAALDPTGRRRFRAALAVEDATWARAQGWVLRAPILGIPYYRDTNPGFAAMSRRALDQVLWGAGTETG